MKVMKLLVIATVVFGFTQCRSLKLENNPPFAIDNAIYSTWAGGQAGVRGMNVTIQLKEASDIVFDSLYFKNKVVKVEFKEATIIIANYSLSKKIPSDIILDIDPKKEIVNKVPSDKKFPFELKKNEAVLSYQVGGITKYYKIPNISKIENNSLERVQ
ncbi:hypothetical protein DUT90_00300 [Polaribacter sp. WD7]|uniref:hypothetical protein n=1 Tax=Polaribacter sp. WD7 TaxID=2269061 RepID=UPI000DF40088|nr:hypothetical protein [Polaribacter sp. WD7]RCS28466.1 hypothetical protein DUT90_00300 [Polaribacter sp. WD7]